MQQKSVDYTGDLLGDDEHPTEPRIEEGSEQLQQLHHAEDLPIEAEATLLPSLSPECSVLNNHNTNNNDNNASEDDDDDDDDCCVCSDDDEEETKSNDKDMSYDRRNSEHSISEEGISMKRIPNMLPKRKIMSTLNAATSYSSSSQSLATLPTVGQSIPQHQRDCHRIFEELNRSLATLQANPALVEFHQDMASTATPFLRLMLLSSEEYLNHPPNDVVLNELLEQLALFRSQCDAIRTRLPNDIADHDQTQAFEEIDANIQQMINVLLSYSANPQQQSQQQQQQQQQPQEQGQQQQQQIQQNQTAPAAQRPTVIGIAPSLSSNTVVYRIPYDLRTFQLVVQTFKFFSQRFDLLLKMISLMCCGAIGLIIHSVDPSYNFTTAASQTPPPSCSSQSRSSFDPFTAVFDWLSFSKSGKILMINVIVLCICLMLLLVKFLWQSIIGSPLTQEHRAQLKKNILRFLPFRHLVLFRVLDGQLWSNQFSMGVFLLVFLQTSISRFYSDFLDVSLKTILLTLNDSFEAEMKVVAKLRKFNRCLLTWNILTTSICLTVFHTASIQVQTALLYGLVVAIGQNLKFETSCRELLQEQGLQYYVTGNTDVVQEPIAVVESNFMAMHLIIKLGYLSWFIMMYFSNKMLGESYSLLVILYYITVSSVITLRKVKEFIRARRNMIYFQQNIDQVFPKLRITDENKDDMCSICHDNLLVGRKLSDCSHAFHLKCLFQWIKTNSNPKCPICRVPIRNAPSLNPSLQQQQNEQQQQQQQQQQQLQQRQPFTFLQVLFSRNNRVIR